MNPQDFQDAFRVVADRGHPATLWLRDDDATVPSAPLETLLTMTGRYGVPCALAVIPAGSGRALADHLAGQPGVCVAVHGWQHQNHAGPAEKKQELGSHRPVPVVLDELSRGLAHLQGLHGAQCVPVLVPPWNRIDPAVVRGLPGIGYAALSVFGPEKPSPLPVLNTHVDVIDWRGSGQVKDLTTLMSEIVAALPRAAPIGLLTHHLIHDARAWAVLERLLALTAEHADVTWTGLPELLENL